jgi:branched-chain amino acid transport system substrate-binding protein
MRITRRILLKGAAGICATGMAQRGHAQGQALRVGVLTPLTGAGGQDGPRMLKAALAVIEEVNKAGGVLGRNIEAVVEDDQTNPEAAVRAAHKLIEFDKVPVIMGTWASAVTSAVAPVCWESQTLLCTVSGADSITQLPHQGYIIRTQPNTKLQATSHAGFIAGLGMKRVAVIGIQAPFALSTKEHLDNVLKAHGAGVVAHIIYEKDKLTYRSEIDQAMKSNPDFLYLNGYAPDTVVLLRDLFKANVNLPKFSQSYAVPQKTLDSIPPEVSARLYTGQPSADIDSRAFKLARERLGNEPDTYEAQATDWPSLVILAAARAKAATGTALKEHVRRISQGSGEKVYSAVEGLALLNAGREINYEGASGPCDFTDIGDIQDCRFRYMEVVDGKLKFLKLV